MKIIPRAIQLTLPISKFCPECRKDKLTSEFSRDKYCKDGLQWRCKSCDSIRHHAYAQLHREEKNAASRARYQLNRAAVIARTSAYHKTHPEVGVRAYKRYVENHREKRLATVLKCVRAWREKNRDVDRAAALRWMREHPEQKRANDRNRRALKRNAEGTYSASEWLALKAAYNFTCLCCGKAEPDIKLTADHVMPLIQGGSNYIANIQPLCTWCNGSKHAKFIDYRPQH